MRLDANPWVGFVARRLLSLVLVLIGLFVAVFLMVRLIPGDPALYVLGNNATEADVVRIRHALGLDQPPLIQLVNYSVAVLHGDLGTSFSTGFTVSTLISQRFATSFQLAAISLAFVLLTSIPGGLMAGAFTQEGRHRTGEVILTGISSVVGSLPEFLTATFLAFMFAVWLRVLPVAGDSGWQSLILPVLAVSLRPTAVLIRIIRVATLDVVATDYIRTARSKRLPARLIYLRHALPNVVTAALTIGGLLFAGIIGGAVVTENVFARTGLGTTLVTAVLIRDYPVVQGITLVLGAIVVIANAVVDILAAVVNPRSLARES